MRRLPDGVSDDPVLRDLLRPRTRRRRSVQTIEPVSPKSSIDPSVGSTVQHEPDSEPVLPLSAGIEPVGLRVRDVLKLIPVGKTKLYELIDAGELDTLKIGKVTVVTMSSIRALLNRSSRRKR